MMRIACEGYLITISFQNLKQFQRANWMHPFRRALQKTRKKLSTDHNHDIHGLWLVVDSEEDCYLALKMVHRLWPEVPGKYMGYITNPKFNEYQSLHIVVLGEDLGPLEIQIRKKTCIYKRNLVSLHIGGTTKVTVNILILSFKWLNGNDGSSNWAM